MKPITFILTLLLTVGPSSAQQADQPGSIEGFVLKAGIGDPVVRARVMLSRAAPGQGSNSVTFTTGGDGKFVFRDVPPGQYRLISLRDGYVRAEYGSLGPTRPGRPLTLAPRQELKDLRVDMTPTGAIAGRVVDRYGDPVGNANVQALKYTYQDGRRVLSVVQSARTNDLGEYRLFWMQPGQYVVSAAPTEGVRLETGGSVIQLGAGAPVAFSIGGGITGPLGNAINLAGQQGLVGAADTGEAYLTVYYPGTTEASSAAPIDIRPGANFTGVDLIVADARAVKVRGRVVSGATNQPVGGTSISLVPRGGTTVGGLSGQRSARANQNGEFELRGIAPGSYELIVTSGVQTFVSFDAGSVVSERLMVSGAAPAGQPGVPPPDSRLGGRVSIEVGTADVENVNVILHEGFNITGRIVMDGRSMDQNNPPPGGMRIQLRPEPAIPQLSPRPGTVLPNGTFSISGVMPGDYRLTVVGVPRTSYLKGAQLNSTDVLNSIVRIDGDPRGVLEILVSSNPGGLDALVQNEKQEQVPGVTVVLVPDPARRRRTDLYRTATSDPNGRIRMDGIVPGDYKLFAWEEVEPGAWQDPDFIRVYEDRGRIVRITEGGRESAEVRMIPYR